MLTSEKSHVLNKTCVSNKFFQMVPIILLKSHEILKITPYIDIRNQRLNDSKYSVTKIFNALSNVNRI